MSRKKPLQLQVDKVNKSNNKKHNIECTTVNKLQHVEYKLTKPMRMTNRSTSAQSPTTTYYYSYLYNNSILMKDLPEGKVGNGGEKSRKQRRVEIQQNYIVIIRPFSAGCIHFF